MVWKVKNANPYKQKFSPREFERCISRHENEKKSRSNTKNGEIDSRHEKMRVWEESRDEKLKTRFSPRESSYNKRTENHDNKVKEKILQNE